MTQTGFIDFQKRSGRQSDPIVTILDQLDLRRPSPLLLRRCLGALRRSLQLPETQWRSLRARLLVVYGFQLLVERSRQQQPTLIQTRMPEDVL